MIQALYTIPLYGVWTFFLIAWIGASTVFYGFLVISIAPIYYKLAYEMMKNWCASIIFFSGIRLTVEGLEKLNPNDQYIFVANHTSAFDIPVLVVGLPHFTNFIAKKELFFIPIFGWGLRAIGHIPINRTSSRHAFQAIKQAVVQLRKTHRSLILFPEGTRSLTGKLGDFKRASFSVVKDAGCKMAPVLIFGAYGVANKKSKLISPGTIKIVIADPIDENTVMKASKEELKEMAYNSIVSMDRKQRDSL